MATLDCLVNLLGLSKFKTARVDGLNMRLGRYVCINNTYIQALCHGAVRCNRFNVTKIYNKYLTFGAINEG